MTNVNQDNQDNTASSGASGLPLRGLAMVLIAVAVILGLWGVYAMTQNSTSSEQAAPETTSAAAPQTTVAAPAPTSAPTEAPEDTTSAPAPAPGANEGPARLNILNNSTVPNLAKDVAGTLGRQGFDIGEVGNVSDIIHPENTVYFQPGNADAERRARELADRVGGVAKEYNQALPDGTNGANDITLVLVNQVAL
ncbi:LytR C-terminal domain-containing protein [Corynebacterium testudinoris]|uniref:LytR cell envelope-related transcriptional attenuator n=1 Tax=Corynebacterium testudinoris TaxID=136857 RepID=A0A0G3HAK0_9CORY|nr:LytR C-terminal domain-containing protein [Corynebacterium testudinoris]AKK09775.1 LytR cell envelope-related transcriptional attenuator [Corynebacterium testudinoris]